MTIPIPVIIIAFLVILIAFCHYVFNNFLFAQNTGLTPQLFPFLEQNHRGNAANLVFRSQLLVFVHVNFYDGDALAQAVFHFFQNGSQHFAGTTPSSKKIDQDRFFRLDDIFETSAHFFEYLLLGTAQPLGPQPKLKIA